MIFFMNYKSKLNAHACLIQEKKQDLETAKNTNRQFTKDL